MPPKIRKRKAATPPPIASPADILTDSQAAEFLHVTSRTLRLWRRTLGLPFIRLTRKELRYRRNDLDAWLDKRRAVIA